MRRKFITSRRAGLSAVLASALLTAGAYQTIGYAEDASDYDAAPYDNVDYDAAEPPAYTLEEQPTVTDEHGEEAEPSGETSVPEAPVESEETDTSVDEESPSIPFLSATDSSDSGVALSWTASEDNVGVVKYIVYRDSEPVAELAGDLLAYEAASLAAGREYVFAVQAVDEAGNGSELSNEVLVSIVAAPIERSPHTIVRMGQGASSHALSVELDGTLWGWGSNSNGQLGETESQYPLKPVRIEGLPAIQEVSAGESHSVALAADGTVWTWGGNNAGQLGIGLSKQQAALPQAVPGIDHAIQVQAGEQHSLALLEDGTVLAWGLNAYGQLGDGTTEDRDLPVQVEGLHDIVSISAGAFHNLAVDREGRVYAWGFNAYGQLGDGTTDNSSTAVLLPGVSDAESVSAGFYHSLALKKNGTVWSWGTNVYGLLGDGTEDNHYLPAQVIGLDSVIEVSSGALHSLVLKTDGTVWAWGANNEDQLGSFSVSELDSPSQLGFLVPIVSVSAGYMSSGAIDGNGTVWTWGYNGSGELGNGTQRNSAAPVAIPLTEQAEPIVN